jgi:putative ABC transport system permease protein
MSRSIAASIRSGDPRAGTGRATRLFQGALVAGEFALALPLLLGAGLLLHSFVNLQRVDPGFDPHRVLTARISLPEAAYSEPPEMLRFWDEALRSVKELPGVEEAGLTTSLPPDNGGDSNNFDLVERPVAPGESEPTVPWSWVTPELFGALGVPLVEGRTLERRDDSPDRPVVVVSRSWARRYFPGESALGKRMYVGGCRECVPSTVVGVVGDVKYAGLAASAESVYEPVRQNPGATLSLVVRASVPPETLAEPIRRRIRAVDPGVPVRDFATMGERLSTSISTPRSLAWLLGAFAAAALVMAALGVFGVMSYVVAQQRREIAVRIALGADAARVVRMVMGRGMARAAAGLAVGAVVSIGAVRAVESMLFEVRTTDPATLAAATALLLAVAVVACWLPGRRAARIEPARAMAAE